MYFVWGGVGGELARGGGGGGGGAKIFRKLKQRDEKDLAGKLATRTSTQMHDFLFQETVTSRQKIYFIVQLYINFWKQYSVFIKYYSLGFYIHVRKKTKFENLSVASLTE